MIREFKDKHQYNYFWIKNDYIHLRKGENSKVYIIKTPDDFHALAQTLSLITN